MDAYIMARVQWLLRVNMDVIHKYIYIYIALWVTPLTLMQKVTGSNPG